MGILSNNPVLEREIRGRLRLRPKGRRAANLWVARLLGVVVAYYYARGLLGILGGTTQDACELWPLLVYGVLSLIVVLAPALAATAITTEREQQTWEILATTRLTGAEVLLGKWLGRQIIPWLLLVILLPYMAVCADHAGFGWPMLPWVLAFLMITTACYSALGLLCSFQAKRTMTATATALTASAFLCLGTIIIDQVSGLLRSHGYGYQYGPALWINPFYALSTMMVQISPDLGSIDPRADPTLVEWYFLLTLTATAGALVFMVRRYRRAVRERS